MGFLLGRGTLSYGQRSECADLLNSYERIQMKILCIILGSLCTFYFIGIAVYAGLSSLFPCIWAAGGVFFYGIAVFLHLNRKHGMLSGFAFPAVLKHGLLVLAVLCVLVFVAVEALIFTGMFHKPSKDLDYIIVLGAQVNGTKLSNSLRLRVERAGEYLEENPEACAVLSGGKGTGEDITEAEAMYRYLVKKGVSPDRLLKEEHSTNTSENLKFSLKIIDTEEDGKGKEASIGVVTNNFHVYRGVALGKKLGCSHIEGIPSKSNTFLQVNYLVREFFGVVKDKAAGNM